MKEITLRRQFLDDALPQLNDHNPMQEALRTGLPTPELEAPNLWPPLSCESARATAVTAAQGNALFFRLAWALGDTKNTQTDPLFFDSISRGLRRLEQEGRSNARDKKVPGVRIVREVGGQLLGQLRESISVATDQPQGQLFHEPAIERSLMKSSVFGALVAGLPNPVGSTCLSDMQFPIKWPREYGFDALLYQIPEYDFPWMEYWLAHAYGVRPAVGRRTFETFRDETAGSPTKQLYAPATGMPHLRKALVLRGDTLLAMDAHRTIPGSKCDERERWASAILWGPERERIENFALYHVRTGQLAEWPVDDFLKLFGATDTAAALREQYADFAEAARRQPAKTRPSLLEQSPDPTASEAIGDTVLVSRGSVRARLMARLRGIRRTQRRQD